MEGTLQPHSPMSEKTINNDLSSPQIGQQVECPFVVIRVTEKKSTNNKLYRNIELKNETGRISTRVWQEKFPLWEGIGLGDPVIVKGRVEDGYPPGGGNVELVVQEIQKLPSPHPIQNHINPVYPGDVADLEAEFDRIREDIRHPGYRRFFDLFFETVCPKEKFFTAPAAVTHHHAYIHGLAEHSIEVTNIARYFADQPALRGLAHRDLVLVGAMIHDSGKIKEIAWEGVPISRKPEAALFDHITSGTLMVYETYLRHEKELAALGFAEQDVKYLIHLVVSHHGRPEWGSPTKPAMVAAEILHRADLMSSQVRKIAEIARLNEPDQYGYIPVSTDREFRGGIFADPVDPYAMVPAAKPASEEFDVFATTLAEETDFVNRLTDHGPGLFDGIERNLPETSQQTAKASFRRR